MEIAARYQRIPSVHRRCLHSNLDLSSHSHVPRKQIDVLLKISTCAKESSRTTQVQGNTEALVLRILEQGLLKPPIMPWTSRTRPAPIPRLVWYVLEV